jgi:uncharacterized membrane protein
MGEQGQSDLGGAQPHGDLAGVQPQTDNDKLISALCYIFWFLVPIIILVTDMKNSRFAKAHAYQGLVFGAIGVAFYFVYGFFWIVMTSILWFFACILWVGYFIPFVLALYVAYRVFTQGQVVFPYLTDLTKSVFKDI